VALRKTAAPEALVETAGALPVRLHPEHGTVAAERLTLEAVAAEVVIIAVVEETQETVDLVYS